MFCEDDLLPLSGLQHMTFCDRRWALVQIEQIWEDNRFTAEGNLIHQKAHSGEIESRPGVLVQRTVPIHSLRLGLSGQADIVEFQPAPSHQHGIALHGRRGLWRPYPIEYKRSRDKAGSRAYGIQLCAQALCLEEMLATDILEGAIYDASTRRRQIVAMDGHLRAAVESTSKRMHALFSSGFTPPPVFKKTCKSCSLIDRCFPERIGQQQSIEAYYRHFLKDVED